MVYRVVGLVVGVGEVVVVPPPVAVIILHLRRAVGGDVDLDTVNTGVKQAVLNTLPPIVSLYLPPDGQVHGGGRGQVGGGRGHDGGHTNLQEQTVQQPAMHVNDMYDSGQLIFSYF